MRILVTYDSHHEEVEKTARFIAEILRREGKEVELADIIEKEIDILAHYDKVVIGSALWFGRLDSAIQKYIQKNQTELLIKATFLFIHAYVNDEAFQAQLARSLPLGVLAHAVTFNLGMDVDTDELNPLDKIKWKALGQKVETGLDEAKIREFIACVLR